MPIKSDLSPVEVTNEPFPTRFLRVIWQHFSNDPQRIALVNAEHPDDCVSYGELYAFSFAVAAFLAQRSFRFADIACAVLPNCWEYAAIFAGVALRGGALSGANPHFTENELCRQFAESRAKIVFCTGSNLDKVLNAATKRATSVQAVVLVEIGRSKKELSPQNVPFRWSAVVIVELSSGNEADLGMPGELFVRGPTRMIGYLGRPNETAETIDGEGWLRTGDIVLVDKHGFITVVDRLKELIKVNGLQVSPSELEDLLLSHPEVQDCAVIGVPDGVSGELPRAIVVRKNGSEVNESEIQQFVKERVVYYKQLKGGVEFVAEVPKSPAGKILRRILRDRMAKAASEGKGGGQGKAKM